jgi:hypothetical protein
MGVADGSDDAAQELGDLAGWLALGFPPGGNLDVLGDPGTLTCGQASTTVGSLQDGNPLRGGRAKARELVAGVM